jgi:Xaa-Pro aminopeptidase
MGCSLNKRLALAVLFGAGYLVGASLLGALDGPPAGEYRARREALRQRIDDGIVVLLGNAEGAGSESYFVFRQESNFYYLSGWSDPGAVLLIAPKSAGEKSLPSEILFLPPRNPSEEAWTGPQIDPKAADTPSRTGFESVRTIGELDDALKSYAKRYRKIYTLVPDPHGSDDEQAVARARVARLQKIVPSANIDDAEKALRKIRQVKSPAEIELIRKAADCSVDAHLAAGRAVQPGMMEYEVAALMKYTFERVGCTNTAFDPIIGSGPRSTILHYTSDQGRMESGDLVVLDVGAEYGDYSADISRTLPVSGHFTPRQREIYQIVLDAQKAVLAAIRPGRTLYGVGSNSLHSIAVEYLSTHGKDLHGNSLGKYFIHGIGHTIGLDVHDLSDRSPVLEEGMVLAIEPGLYLPEENIGVRIEDNVLVTKDGCEVLTRRLPSEPGDVERWMQERTEH